VTRLLRRLNGEGIAAWCAWLQGRERGDPPRHLLDDRATSEPVFPATALLPRGFANRYEFGAHLVELLRGHEIARVRFEAGLWDWLSLHYFDLVCPVDPAGKRRVGEAVRYAFDVANHQKRARHLVRTAWSLVQQHGESARFMLGGPPHVHGDMVEQLANRQEIIGSRSLIGAASLLYWEEERQTFKVGAATRESRRGGTVRRLIDIAMQFKLTYDLDSMTPEQILELLPPEFDRWRAPSPTRPIERPHLGGWFDRFLGRSG
jgi:hypothetical protein